MKYLNLEVGFLTSPEFVGADPVQRATWLCLLAHCVRQENGGVISGCDDWGDRRWGQTCGVTKEEVAMSCELYKVESGSVYVWGYPLAREMEMKAKREGGKRGGSASTQAKIQASRENGAKHNPSSTQAEPKVEPNGKGKGKGMVMGMGSGSRAREEDFSVSGITISIPTLEAVIENGIMIGMTEADCKEFYTFWTNAGWKDKNGIPVRNWKSAQASRKNQIAERKAENANSERNGNQNRNSTTQHGRVTATGKGKW